MNNEEKKTYEENLVNLQEDIQKRCRRSKTGLASIRKKNALLKMHCV